MSSHIGVAVLALATILISTPSIARAQSPILNPITDILTNAVDTANTNFAAESFQLRVGTENLGIGTGGFGLTLGASWHATSMLTLETKFVNQSLGGNLLDGLIGAGVTKSYGNFQFTGAILGGWNFETNAGEGEGLLRISYLPSQKTRIGMYTEVGLKMAPGSTRPGSILGAGICYSF